MDKNKKQRKEPLNDLERELDIRVGAETKPVNHRAITDNLSPERREKIQDDLQKEAAKVMVRKIVNFEKMSIDAVSEIAGAGLGGEFIATESQRDERSIAIGGIMHGKPYAFQLSNEGTMLYKHGFFLDWMAILWPIQAVDKLRTLGFDLEKE